MQTGRACKDYISKQLKASLDLELRPLPPPPRSVGAREGPMQVSKPHSHPPPHHQRNEPLL